MAPCRESLLHSLGEEQALHRRQLRQLQVALRSSLGHIRGLKVGTGELRELLMCGVLLIKVFLQSPMLQALIQDSSSPPLQPPVDEASLSHLLQLTPHRSTGSMQTTTSSTSFPLYTQAQSLLRS